MTTSEILTSAIGLLQSLGLMPIIFVGAIIGAAAFLLWRVRSAAVAGGADDYDLAGADESWDEWDEAEYLESIRNESGNYATFEEWLENADWDEISTVEDAD